MHKILFEIPGTPFKFHGFGAMLCAAFLAGMFLAEWRARRERLNPDWAWDLGIWVIVGGLVGARGLYVAQYWGRTIHHWWDVFAIWEGGIVLYGGVIGGMVAGVIRARQIGAPILAMCDVFAPSIALGLALGRIGCFLNGCCYGDPCDLPWAVQFPAESSPWYNHLRSGAIVYPQPTAKPPYLAYVEFPDSQGGPGRIRRDWVAQAEPEPPHSEIRSIQDPQTGKPSNIAVERLSISSRSLPVHPTQLYSSIDGLILLGLATAYFPMRRRDGEVAALLLVTYSITRFLIEILRGDEGVFFAGLTISQTVSVGLFAAGVALWVWLRLHPKPLYASRELAAAPAEEPLTAPAHG